MTKPDCSYERPFWHEGKLVAGVDEAGRGCLAGPVVAAAVVLQPFDERLVAVVADSKQLSAQRRCELYELITSTALDWRVAVGTVEQIEERNILRATLEAMAEAIAALEVEVAHVLIDGPKVPALRVPTTAVVRGDSRSASIAAASIVAKVTRDRLMTEAAALYPQYGFERHKGYPTAEHFRAIEQWGITPLHRRSFLLKWQHRTAQLSAFDDHARSS